jgi:tetratricopeptide (TPR) repeat protein
MNKKKLITLVLLCIVFLIVVFSFAFIIQYVNEINYDSAKGYLENGQYYEAQEIFSNLGKYKNSESLLKETDECISKKEIYNNALEDYENKKYDSAIDKLKTIREFEDSESQIDIITYDYAKKLFNENQLIESRKYFLQIEGYQDSAEYISRIDIKMADSTARAAYNEAKSYYDGGSYQLALTIYDDLGDYDDSREMAALCRENIQRLNLSHTIAGGIGYSLGLTDEGKVKTAGSNSANQCNVDLWEEMISIDGYGIYTIGLKKDGTVNVAGNLNEKQKEEISTWEHIVDVAAGERYVVALRSDGKVESEGHNGDGQCDVDSWRNVIDIDTGWRFTVGLTENGELLFAGHAKELIKAYNANKDEWKDVVKISASGGEPDGKERGGGHVVGLKSDGTVIAIGDNEYGQCDVDNAEWKKGIVEIATGDWYTVGLTEGGNVVITGQNVPNTQYIDMEKISNWKNIKDIAAGYGQTLVLKDDGYVDSMGFDDDEKRSDISAWESLSVR